MRRSLQLAAAVLMLTTALGARAQLHLKHDKPQLEDLSWMWQYTQPDSKRSQENALLWDSHFHPFLQDSLKTPQTFWDKNKPLSEVAMEFLAVPGDVVADDNRYITADGCVQHFCPDRGLLWVDLGRTHPLVVFAAIDWISENHNVDDRDAAYTMWVFSNHSIDPARIPSGLTHSIARWTSQPYGKTTHLQNITRVFFIDPDGTAHPVTPSSICARNTLPPETTTESGQESTVANQKVKVKP
jgi:hypothetical protein